MPLNIDLQQILLHWMNLAILTGGLYFLLFKPVKEFMDKRRALYEELDRQAADKLAQADRLAAEHQAKLDRAGEELRQERAQLQQAAAQAAQEQLDRAEEEAKRIVGKAHAEAEQSRERVLRESQRELRDLAVQAARKLAAQPGTDPFDQFLELTEGGKAHEGR